MSKSLRGCDKNEDGCDYNLKYNTPAPASCPAIHTAPPTKCLKSCWLLKNLSGNWRSSSKHVVCIMAYRNRGTMVSTNQAIKLWIISVVAAALLSSALGLSESVGDLLEPTVKRHVGALPPSACQEIIALGEATGFTVEEESIDEYEDNYDVSSQSIDVYERNGELAVL